MQKVIVTGATGFIGKNVVRELINHNITVIAIVRKGTTYLHELDGLNIRIVECNMDELSNLPNRISDRDIDAVFHIAWQGVSDKLAKDYSCQLANVHNTMHLLEAMAEMNINTFVGAGSIHEMECIVEVNNNLPASNMSMMYKASKLAAHSMSKALAGTLGIKFLWPIIINAYGEEEYSARLINTMIRKIYNGESPKLSSGEQLYDFVHVKDIARAMVLVGEKGIDGKNYVIGTGKPRPLREFLEKLGEVANNVNKSNVPLDFGSITNNVISLPREFFDTSSLIHDTGFCISIPFEEGITRTAKWLYYNQRDVNWVGGKL